MDQVRGESGPPQQRKRERHGRVVIDRRYAHQNAHQVFVCLRLRGIRVLAGLLVAWRSLSAGRRQHRLDQIALLLGRDTLPAV